ncbi:MAG: hypothetical protein ACI8QQ_002400 [Psychroserpens sp.]|jgi:hypothetical protein
MFIDAQKFGYQKDLSFFLLLKLIFRTGKARLDNQDLQFVEYVEQIKCRKTTIRYISLFLELGFISYNGKTGYYTINSFDKIRQFHNWDVRLAFPIDYSNYKKIQAVTGAVIYGYLHKDFWRCVKREKSVQIHGSTYSFLSNTFNYKKQYAPVSVIGVYKIFDISIATASRLKNAAFKEGLIKLKKNYGNIVNNKSIMQLCLEYNDKRNNIVFNNGKYRLQLIDTVYPIFYFIKRTNLKT